MADQIRSADLLVKTALASPEILEALKTKPEETLKTLGKDAMQQLPQPLPPPGRITNDIIWLIVVTSFTGVMLWSAYVLGANVLNEIKTGVQSVTKGEIILTLFSTVAAFLAGLLAPSPMRGGRA